MPVQSCPIPCSLVACSLPGSSVHRISQARILDGLSFPSLHVSFQISVSVFSNIYPGVELLGHMIVLFLVFWETSILFSIVDAPIYISTIRGTLTL